MTFLRAQTHNLNYKLQIVAFLEYQDSDPKNISQLNKSLQLKMCSLSSCWSISSSEFRRSISSKTYLYFSTTFVEFSAGLESEAKKKIRSNFSGSGLLQELHRNRTLTFRKKPDASGK